MSAPTRLGLRAAPWILWFAVLGGAVAWTTHTLVQWSIDETVCRSGHDEIGGIPLRPLLVGISLLLLGVSLTAGVVGYRQWNTLRNAEGTDARGALGLERAEFMALVGFVADYVFALILLCGVVTVLVFPVCGR